MALPRTMSKPPAGIAELRSEEVPLCRFCLEYFFIMIQCVKPDHKEALVWLRKASVQGSEEAKTFLSEIGE